MPDPDPPLIRRNLNANRFFFHLQETGSSLVLNMDNTSSLLNGCLYFCIPVYPPLNIRESLFRLANWRVFTRCILGHS